MIERINLYDQIASNKRKAILFIVLFSLLIMAIGWLFGAVSGWGNAGLVLAVIISVILSGVSYYYGDSIVLSTSGAVPADERQFRKLHDIVEGISIAAGVPKPKVYIINDDAINAFATGKDPEHASVAVTTGALTKLTKEELEGVLGHELSHVKNYDIRFMAIVAVMAGVIVLLSDWLLRSMFWGGGRNREENGGGGVFLIVIAVIAAILAPLFAQLIKMAISRQREFLADADGALVTRNPEALARALGKIGKDDEQMKTASNATAHLYIANPFKEKNWVSNLFSTHPPIEERIRRLNAM